MVVGITIATITYFRTRVSSGEATVFQPDQLRAAIEKHAEEDEPRERCLEICDALQRQVDAYDENVLETLETYLKNVQDYGSTAAELDALFDPLADAREATLLACLDARERLVLTLDEASWRAVFGETS